MNPAVDPYVPGLGEIMTLRCATRSSGWPVRPATGSWPDGEIKELGEGFDDVIAFHPTHEDSPIAPEDAIPRMIRGPLAAIDAAVADRDEAAFERAYDALTKACNGCHQATDFGFNRVRRPSTNPLPNQDFAPDAP